VFLNEVFDNPFSSCHIIFRKLIVSFANVVVVVVAVVVVADVVVYLRDIVTRISFLSFFGYPDFRNGLL